MRVNLAPIHQKGKNGSMEEMGLRLRIPLFQHSNLPEKWNKGIVEEMGIRLVSQHPLFHPLPIPFQPPQYPGF